MQLLHSYAGTQWSTCRYLPGTISMHLSAPLYVRFALHTIARRVLKVE